MKYHFCFLFILVSCLHTQWVKGQERIFVLDSIGSSYNMNDCTYFLEENSGEIKPENLLESAFSEKMPLFSTHTTPPKSNHNYWYKVQLHNRLKNKVDFVLEIGDFPIMEFYIFDSQKQLIRYEKTGKSIPLSERAWQLKANSLPIAIPYQDTMTVVCKVQIAVAFEGFNDVRLTLGKAYTERILKRLEFQLFFYGAMTLMLFYNLFFFFMVRDKAYLYYTLYILSMLLVSLDDDHSIASQYPYWNEIIIKCSSLFVTVLYTQFIRYFLNIGQVRPVLNRYCDYWVYARMAFALTIMFIFLNSANKAIFENPYVLLVFIVDILLGLLLMYVAWKRNPILVAHLIFGYLAMVLPLSVVIMKQIVSNVNPETDGAVVQIGVLIELILFSIGLGYRSRVAERERLQAAEENRLLVQDQNIVLEKKVEERTEELNTTLSTVSKQRDDIVSSINYALRIQKAIIPQEAEIQSYFAESFVFFRPKDIVSGDFYWFADKGDTKIIAVADCTGHGVSGAFMTMIGNNILNQIVHDQEIYQPDEILNQMPILLEKTLSHSEGKVKDGMDISILTIKTSKNSEGNASAEVTYAGAMNPLYYVQNQAFFEIKADKVPVGGKRKEDFAYQRHEIELHGETTFYLLSDGFQDQFGGDQDRKFMVGKFKKLLSELSEKPLTEQKEVLEQTFDTWKGHRKQTDDVLVMGIRL